MGLFDFLRRPKEPHVVLARFLGSQLERISPSNLRDPPRGEEFLRLVNHLDFVVTQAFHAVPEGMIDDAVREWSTCADPDAIRVAARWFRYGSWYDRYFGLKERPADSGTGLMWLRDALIRAGILPGPLTADRLSAPRPDPKSVAGLMADIILPDGPEEEWLLARLERLTRKHAGGPLLNVRIAALRMAALAEFRDRDFECQYLVDAVTGRVLDRRQWKDPRDLVERALAGLSKQYLDSPPPKDWENRDVGEAFAAMMGPTFAAQCDSTDGRVTRLGGEEYLVAFHRLHDLAIVAAEAPFLSFGA